MSIEMDEVGCVRHRGTDGEERITWAELVAVRIVTTDEGPLQEDLFWLLINGEGKGCAVPGEFAAPLLKRLQRLPRFDNEAVINATLSTDNAQFDVWSGTAGEGIAAGAPVE